MAITSTGTGKSKVIRRFTANGTFVVPAGVFFAEAEVAGGGAGGNTGQIAGGNTTVAFTGGSIVASGMTSAPTGNSQISGIGTPNTGGGRKVLTGGSYGQGGAGDAGNYEVEIVNPTFGGATVAPGTNCAVTIGAGGGSNPSAGGSGYAIITFYR